MDFSPLMIYFLVWSIMTVQAFHLAQSLRAAINRGDKVRNIAKAFCSIFCIFVGLFFLFSHLSVAFHTKKIFILAFHTFIIIFQMVMIWLPKPE